jgi:hypothetical protein
MKSWIHVSGIRMRRPEVTRAVALASLDPLRKCAAEVEREAKQLLSVGGGSGRVPSPPGIPPHLQTGALRASVSHALLTMGGMPAAHGIAARAIVGPTETYGKYHEFGSRVHPQRKFMLPALLRCHMRFAHLFRRLRLKGNAG